MLRASWKSLLGRKLRLFMRAFAIILGVAFVSGSFIITGWALAIMSRTPMASGASSVPIRKRARPSRACTPPALPLAVSWAAASSRAS